MPYRTATYPPDLPPIWGKTSVIDLNDPLPGLDRKLLAREAALVSQRSARYMSHFEGNSCPRRRRKHFTFDFKAVPVEVAEVGSFSCSCSCSPSLSYSPPKSTTRYIHTYIVYHSYGQIHSSHSPLSVGFGCFDFRGFSSSEFDNVVVSVVVAFVVTQR